MCAFTLAGAQRRRAKESATCASKMPDRTERIGANEPERRKYRPFRTSRSSTFMWVLRGYRGLRGCSRITVQPLFGSSRPIEPTRLELSDRFRTATAAPRAQACGAIITPANRDHTRLVDRRCARDRDGPGAMGRCRVRSIFAQGNAGVGLRL